MRTKTKDQSLEEFARSLPPGSVGEVPIETVTEDEFRSMQAPDPVQRFLDIAHAGSNPDFIVESAETVAIDEIVEKGEALKALALDCCTQEEITSRLNDFLRLSSYQPFGLQLESHNIWNRGRVVEACEPIKQKLEELIYPKKPSGNYGRLHYPDQRVFYASWNRPAVLAELTPEAGDKIQYIMCRPRTDATVMVTVVGAYEHFYQSGGLFYHSPAMERDLGYFFQRTSKDLVKKTLYVDSFLAALFRETDTSWYRVTRAFAQRVFRAKTPSGLLYPSVRTVAAVNLAIPDWVFDDCFDVLSSDVCEIKKSYGYGVYDSECQPPPMPLMEEIAQAHNRTAR